jgi:hypothetical protein
MMRVCVPVVIKMHSHTCAFMAVVLKIDRCICTYILWKYSKGMQPIYKRIAKVCTLYAREERKVLSWRGSSILVI